MNTSASVKQKQVKFRFIHCCKDFILLKSFLFIRIIGECRNNILFFTPLIKTVATASHLGAV